MLLIRGADELIVGGMHQIPVAADDSGDPVYILLGRFPCFLRLFFDFLAMLVCAGLKDHIVALISLIAGNGIRQNDLIGIADVRLGGSIGDGRGNKVRFLSMICILSIPCKCPDKGPVFLYCNI